MFGIVNKRIAALMVLVLAAAFAAVPAQAHTNAYGKKSVAPKPVCTVGPIVYNDQTAVVAVKSGKCYWPWPASAHKKPRWIPARWNYIWIGYDHATPASIKGRGAGKGRSFTINPGLFYTMKVTFIATSPKAWGRPMARASKTQTITSGGSGSTGQTLNSGPGTTPPTDGSLCLFHDPYLEKLVPKAQCGVAVPGANAFVAPPPSVAADGTVAVGKWLSPAGPCAVPPEAVKGPYQWFGHDVYGAGLYLCGGDNKLRGAVGVVTITLHPPGGASSCTLHPNNWSVATFHIPPEWGGTLDVTFDSLTFDATGNMWPDEYETARLQMPGGQSGEDGCTSPLWNIPNSSS